MPSLNFKLKVKVEAKRNETCAIRLAMFDAILIFFTILPVHANMDKVPQAAGEVRYG